MIMARQEEEIVPMIAESEDIAQKKIDSGEFVLMIAETDANALMQEHGMSMKKIDSVGMMKIAVKDQQQAQVNLQHLPISHMVVLIQEEMQIGTLQ